MFLEEAIGGDAAGSEELANDLVVAGGELARGARRGHFALGEHEDAIGNLQRAGLIRYKRGRIDVLDRPQLEKTVCECYAVVKAEFDRLLADIPRDDAPRGIDRRAGKSKRR